MDLSPLTDAMAEDATPLVRTDCGDDPAWHAIVTAVMAPVNFADDPNPDLEGEGFPPHVTPVDDPAFVGLDGTRLAETWSAEADIYGYVLLADARSMAEAASGEPITVVYVDMSVRDDEDAELFATFLGRSFRCEVGEVAGIDANLSIANMDFSEFADSVGADGVFRGFDA